MAIRTAFILFLIARFGGLVQPHVTGRLQIFGSSLSAELQPRAPQPQERYRRSFLTERQSTTGPSCGVQNGGISCPSGQCCSSDGHCGTGEAYCRSPECQFQYGPACDFWSTPVGESTSNVPRPILGAVSYTSAGILQCVVPGTVALTYDDGPYLYTSELLDELKAANAKATFFVTGNNYYKHGIDNPNTPYPDLIRRMHEEGHQIASHTWTHEDLDKITPSQRHDQMIKNEMAFRNILGFFPTYMRPPYDSCTIPTGCRGDITGLGYHIVEYTIDTEDWINQTPDLIQLSKNIVMADMQGHNPATDSFIAYAHDTYPQTVSNLTQFMLSYINGQGYRIVTVGECLNDPKENWYRDAISGQSSNGVINSISSPPPTSTSSTSVALAAAMTSPTSSSQVLSTTSATSAITKTASATTMTTNSPTASPTNSAPRTSSHNWAMVVFFSSIFILLYTTLV